MDEADFDHEIRGEGRFRAEDLVHWSFEPPSTPTPYAFCVALSADQLAMLQLLLERGQSYSDLASLLGVDEAEVRARARATLAELAGADPDRHVGLTDYLLGQADPIGRADAVRHLKDDPADLELATEITQKIRLVAPAAELPRLPGEERRPRPRRAPGGVRSRLPIPDRLQRRRPADAESGPGGVAAAPGAPRTTMSRRQTQLLVGLASGAVLALAIILGVAGAFGGGDSGDGTTTTATTTANAGKELTRVKLQPQSGGGGSGTVIFGLEGSQPYVDVTLNGLTPPPQNQALVIWFLLTANQGYPLAVVAPCSSSVPEPCLSENGSYHDRVSIDPKVFPVVLKVQSVDVAIAGVDELTKALNNAFKNQKVAFKRPGTSVLRGEISSSRGGKGAG